MMIVVLFFVGLILGVIIFYLGVKHIQSGGEGMVKATELHGPSEAEEPTQPTEQSEPTVDVGLDVDLTGDGGLEYGPKINMGPFTIDFDGDIGFRL